MSVIEIRDLSFSYDKQVILEDINLRVEEKDFLQQQGFNNAKIDIGLHLALLAA